MNEPEKKKLKNFRLPLGTLAKLMRLAEKESRTMTNMVTVLIDREAEKQGVKDE